jgi:hypothetical protein
MGPAGQLLGGGLAAGASAYGDKWVRDQQREKMNAAARRTRETQDEAVQRLLAEAQTMAPTARGEAMAAQEGQNYQQALSDLTGGAALDANGNSIIDTAGDAGAVSSEFMARKADKALAEGDRLSAIARELAKTRSTGDVMRAENQRRAAVTGDVNSLWSSTKNMNNAAMQDAEAVQQPWYGQLGKIGLALAGQMAGQGGGGRISFTG